MNRWHLLTVVVLAGLCYIGVSYLKAQPVNWELVFFASLVASFLGSLILLFDRWLWRLPFLHPWFVSFPDLNGSWKNQTDVASFLSNLPKTKRYLGQVIIDQRFFSILMSAQWDDGATTKFLERVPISAKGSLYSFAAVFTNYPRVGFDEPGETKTAGYFFHEESQRPKSLTLFFSTIDKQLAKVELTRVDS